jgi:hypothetical protein
MKDVLRGPAASNPPDSEASDFSAAEIALALGGRVVGPFDDMLAEMRRARFDDIAKAHEKREARASALAKRRAEAPPSPPPAGMSRAKVARYIGVSANTFDKLVAAGTMPASIAVPGLRRRVWLRRQIDAALAQLAGVPPPAPRPSTDEDQPNEWDSVLQ